MSNLNSVTCYRKPFYQKRFYITPIGVTNDYELLTQLTSFKLRKSILLTLTAK